MVTVGLIRRPRVIATMIAIEKIGDVRHYGEWLRGSLAGIEGVRYGGCSGVRKAACRNYVLTSKAT